MNNILIKIRLAFNKLGFDIKRIYNLKEIDCDKNNFLPERERVSLEVYSRIACLPISKGRSLPIHNLTNDGYHPFIYASTRALKLRSEERYGLIKKILKEYYDLVSPKSAGHLFDSPKESKLYDYPTWAVIMPWQVENIDFWMNHVRETVKLENQIKYDINSGWAWTGPSDQNKLSIETKRLSVLLDSILINGYKRHNGKDGDINATILYKDNNEWVWQASAAQHRACVLSALGRDSIQVRVTKYVKRNEVASWPQVINGFFSVDEALNIFDKIFDGDFDEVCKKWHEYIKKNKL